MSRILGRSHRLRRAALGIMLAGAVLTAVYSADDVKRYVRMRSM